MKYLFIGNRMAVLNEMLLMELDVTVIPIPKTKKELFKRIVYTEFDILISNGCPYILPISCLERHNQIFVNIHPSLLPDLKGKSPILEAIKQHKPFGATCHLMVDEVDSGKILSQVRYEADRNDLNDCYRQSYKAEVRAFKLAYKKGFK
jgi:methionyl-tRNA formyltransferase